MSVWGTLIKIGDTVGFLNPLPTTGHLFLKQRLKCLFLSLSHDPVTEHNPFYHPLFLFKSSSF